MKRYIVVDDYAASSQEKIIMYYARGIHRCTQFRPSVGTTVYTSTQQRTPVVEPARGIFYNYHPLWIHECEISENQPNGESVVEHSTSGAAIAVFNENWVKVCDNGIPLSNFKPADQLAAQSTKTETGEKPTQEEPIEIIKTNEVI